MIWEVGNKLTDAYDYLELEAGGYIQLENGKRILLDSNVDDLVVGDEPEAATFTPGNMI